mmetsp:Transcript_18609/g.41500  ORF Transcript_18609/g.41500 Transcript_18609/m.41500 type:complete len:798 (+) Transcript_18609:42-2435(+)
MRGERAAARHFPNRGGRGNDRNKTRISRSDGKIRPMRFRDGVRRQERQGWGRKSWHEPPDSAPRDPRDNSEKDEGREEEPDWGSGGNFDLAEVCTRLKALPNLQRDMRDREVQSLFEVLSHSSFDDFMHQHASNPSQVEPLLKALQGLTCFPRHMRETLAKKLQQCGCDIEAGKRPVQRRWGNARLWGRKALTKQRTGANSIHVEWRPPSGEDNPNEAVQDEPEEKHEGAKPKSAPRPPPQLTSTEDHVVGPAGRGHSSTTPAWMTKYSEHTTANAPDGSAGHGRGRDMSQHSWQNSAPSIPAFREGRERPASERGGDSPRARKHDETRHNDHGSSAHKDGQLHRRGQHGCASREDRHPHGDGRSKAGDGRHPSKARGHERSSRRSRSRPGRQNHNRREPREQPSRGGRPSRSRARPDNSRHHPRQRSPPQVRLSAAKPPALRASPARKHRETPQARGRDESRPRHEEASRPQQGERRSQRPSSDMGEPKRRRKASLQASQRPDEKSLRERVAALKLLPEGKSASTANREPAVSSSHPLEKRRDGGSNQKVAGRFGRPKRSPTRGHSRAKQGPPAEDKDANTSMHRPQEKGKGKGGAKQHDRSSRRKRSPSKRRSRSKDPPSLKPQQSDDHGRADFHGRTHRSPKVHSQQRSPRQMPQSASQAPHTLHQVHAQHHQVSHAPQLAMHAGMHPGMPHMPQQGQSPYGVPPGIKGVNPAMQYYGHPQANIYAPQPPVMCSPTTPAYMPPPPGQHCMPQPMPAMPALPPPPASSSSQVAASQPQTAPPSWQVHNIVDPADI